MSKLAEDHWDWVHGLVDRTNLAGMDHESYVSLLWYIYTTAFDHGYKHAVEDLGNEEPKLPHRYPAPTP